MSKFGMYTKGTNEGRHHISLIEMPSKNQAVAYFAGVKKLSLNQFNNLFDVREIQTNQNNKNLLLG
tara:strand:- start:789 stop:986 length:198 start_codon:yes stop_codon:yes gene_type:complete